MIDWTTVWENKGNLATDDLRVLSGFENTTANSEDIARQIIETLDIHPEDRVLEIGCGAGALAKFIAPICSYVGIDTSKSLISKHQKLFHHTVNVMEAAKLDFPSRSFDKVFAFSVFHYFQDTPYFEQARDEVLRVARDCVYICDLPRQSHDASHLLYSETQFDEWKITPGYYNPDRFNAFLQL